MYAAVYDARHSCPSLSSSSTTVAWVVVTGPFVAHTPCLLTLARSCSHQFPFPGSTAPNNIQLCGFKGRTWISLRAIT